MVNFGHLIITIVSNRVPVTVYERISGQVNFALANRFNKKENLRTKAYYSQFLDLWEAAFQRAKIEGKY